MSESKEKQLTDLTKAYTKYQNIFSAIVRGMRYKHGSVKEGDDYDVVLSDYLDHPDNSALGSSFLEKKKNITETLEVTFRRMDLADQFEELHDDLTATLGAFLRGHTPKDLTKFVEGRDTDMLRVISKVEESTAEKPPAKKGTVDWEEEKPAVDWEGKRKPSMDLEPPTRKRRRIKRVSFAEGPVAERTAILEKIERESRLGVLVKEKESPVIERDKKEGPILKAWPVEGEKRKRRRRKVLKK
ncbi:MAG: hypothetical protein KAW41_03625 [Candidatus Diapherotrites archaeon]|nr:hypothetical protein [Candidatus Diapherotrites archaeon]